MVNSESKLDLLFETSWEVCNKVGGIYAVLSTKAKKISTLNVYPLMEISRLQFKMTIDAEKDVTCISNETSIRFFDFAQNDII